MKRTEQSFYTSTLKPRVERAGARIGRIEAPTDEGIPDTYILYESVIYFVELKIIRNERIKIRRSQVAWHMGFTNMFCKGAAYILAVEESNRYSSLYYGRKAQQLKNKPLEEVEAVATYPTSTQLICFLHDMAKHHKGVRFGLSV